MSCAGEKSRTAISVASQKYEIVSIQLVCCGGSTIVQVAASNLRVKNDLLNLFLVE